MRQTKVRIGGRAEKGSIAVETIFCLPILILFLVVPLFFARVFWYYSVAQKAAHDGARFLASAPQFEIMPPAGGGARLPVATLAEAIALEELSDIRPALERYTITALCDLDACGFEVPNTVRVSVRLKVRDEIFGPFTNQYFGEEALSLEARVTMRYAGN